MINPFVTSSSDNTSESVVKCSSLINSFVTSSSDNTSESVTIVAELSGIIVATTISENIITSIDESFTGPFTL